MSNVVKRNYEGMQHWPESLLLDTVAMAPQATVDEAEGRPMSTVQVLSVCARLELAARQAHWHCGPGFARRIRDRARRIWENN